MNNERMPEVIDRLFKRLSATYGASWTRQWEGTPMQDVKTAWCHELGGYAGNLPAIAHALDNLPERCPNVIQFRNLCRAAPGAVVQRIEPPKADPIVVAKVLAGLSPVAANPHGMKAWAYRLIARHEQGEKIRPYLLNLARGALRIGLPVAEAA